jgi:mono/diheme cytochrome c family protein
MAAKKCHEQVRPVYNRCRFSKSKQNCDSLHVLSCKEKPMFVRRVMPALMVVAVFALISGAQEQPKKTIQHVPIKPASPASGKEMYTSYCAVCHGTDGKGNGPAAEALKTPPPDLTILSKNNAGKYPALKVSSAIRGDARVAAHGSKDMPVWGHLFRSISRGHDSEVDQRVANLVSYIESLQSQ